MMSKPNRVTCEILQGFIKKWGYKLQLPSSSLENHFLIEYGFPRRLTLFDGMQDPFSGEDAGYARRKSVFLSGTRYTTFEISDSKEKQAFAPFLFEISHYLQEEENRRDYIQKAHLDHQIEYLERLNRLGYRSFNVEKLPHEMEPLELKRFWDNQKRDKTSSPWKAFIKRIE